MPSRATIRATRPSRPKVPWPPRAPPELLITVPVPRKLARSLPCRMRLTELCRAPATALLSTRSGPISSRMDTMRSPYPPHNRTLNRLRSRRSMARRIIGG